MKKLLAIIMIVLFGFSSSGATVQLHYCCGKLKSVSWGSIQEKDCGMKDKMGSRPCCETKSVSAKDQNQDHELYTIALGSASPVEPIQFSHPVSVPVTTAHMVTGIQPGSSPPLSQSLCILHCVFRI